MRMVVVLAFLIGMPLVAVPHIGERLPMLFTFTREQHERTAASPPSAIESGPAADGTKRKERSATASSRATYHTQPASVVADADEIAATIEALKARFVTAGVTYMMLEQIGTDVPSYRFQFDLPVAAGSAYTKRFQVVDAAPDEAMRQALMELSQWRVAGREPDHLERPTVILR